MSDRYYHVILNTKAGTAIALGLTAETLGERFAHAGLHFDIDADDTTPMEDRIAKAVAGPADTIVAAGGDGTVTSIAEALIGTDKTLAVLPLGTMNALSKDLGIPLDLDEAVASLSQLEPRRIDVAAVNGQLFLHNVLIGVIPGIAAAREAVRHEHKAFAWFGMLRFVIRRLARARRMAIAIEPADGPHHIARLQAIAVANNHYDEAFGAFMTRKRIDRGHLSIYTLKSLGLFDAIRLGIEMLAGRWRDDTVIDFAKTHKVVLRSRKRRMLVTIDGEVMTLPTPLEFEIRPLALSVLAMPVEETVEAPSPEPQSLAELIPAGV